MILSLCSDTGLDQETSGSVRTVQHQSILSAHPGDKNLFPISSHSEDVSHNQLFDFDSWIQYGRYPEIAGIGLYPGFTISQMKPGGTGPSAKHAFDAALHLVSRHGWTMMSRQPKRETADDRVR